MGKIIAIGGGEIGRPGFTTETTKIDKEIIKLSGKKHPNVLFIPTASSDAGGYMKTFNKHFGKNLGCKIKTLLLVKKLPPYSEIKKQILSSDIVYVGGGNTYAMLKIWRKLKVDKILKEAYDKGIILSGLSAGAICWFTYGSSDLGNFKKLGNKIKYKKLKGMGLIPLLLSPHHIRETKRKNFLIEFMRKTPGTALALDDYSAIEIVDNTYKIITSKPIAKAHKVFWKSGKLYYDEIPKTKIFMPLASLLSK